MLRLNTSESGSRLGVGGDPVPCVQCERREVGLAWGDYCSVCREERRLLAGARAQRAAILAAIAMAAYLFWKTPPKLGPRVFAATSVLLVYVIIRRIVSRLLMDYLPKRSTRPAVEEERK